MLAFIRRFPTVSFFVLAYGISWAVWIPMLLSGARVAPGSTTTHFPGLVGPAIAALLVQGALHGRAGLQALWRRSILVSRPIARFWWYSLSPVVFLAAALVAMVFLGKEPPTLAEFGRFSGLPELGLPIVVVLVLVFGGFGEELGWRGFALERLQNRFGAIGGTLLLALLWAGWHVPAFGVIQTYREMTPPMIVFGFLLGLVSGSIVLANISNRTAGSVLAAALWHASYNLTAATSAGGGFISGFTTTCVMLWAAAAVVLELRHGTVRSILRVRAGPVAADRVVSGHPPGVQRFA